jgi:hypothetical protein
MANIMGAAPTYAASSQPQQGATGTVAAEHHRFGAGIVRPAGLMGTPTVGTPHAQQAGAPHVAHAPPVATSGAAPVAVIHRPAAVRPNGIAQAAGGDPRWNSLLQQRLQNTRTRSLVQVATSDALAPASAAPPAAPAPAPAPTTATVAAASEYVTQASPDELATAFQAMQRHLQRQITEPAVSGDAIKGEAASQVKHEEHLVKPEHVIKPEHVVKHEHM